MGAFLLYKIKVDFRLIQFEVEYHAFKLMHRGGGEEGLRFGTAVAIAGKRETASSLCRMHPDGETKRHSVPAISALGASWKPRKPPIPLSFLASLSLLAALSPSHSTLERTIPMRFRCGPPDSWIDVCKTHTHARARVYVCVCVCVYKIQHKILLNNNYK